MPLAWVMLLAIVWSESPAATFTVKACAEFVPTWIVSWSAPFADWRLVDCVSCCARAIWETAIWKPPGGTPEPVAVMWVGSLEVICCAVDHVLGLISVASWPERVVSWVWIAWRSVCRVVSSVCWLMIRCCGICSIDISCWTIVFVSRPDARPPMLKVGMSGLLAVDVLIEPAMGSALRVEARGVAGEHVQEPGVRDLVPARAGALADVRVQLVRGRIVVELGP